MNLLACFVVFGSCLALGACNQSATTENTSASMDMAPDGMSAAPNTEFCKLTMQDEKLGECDRLRAQYAGLDAGVDAFKPNARMREYDQTTVSYAITRLPDSVQGGNGNVAKPVRHEQHVILPPGTASAIPVPPGPARACHQRHAAGADGRRCTGHRPDAGGDRPGDRRGTARRDHLDRLG